MKTKSWIAIICLTVIASVIITIRVEIDGILFAIVAGIALVLSFFIDDDNIEYKENPQQHIAENNTNRDTFVYRLLDEDEIVYYGITKNPNTKPYGHKHDRKRFSKFQIVSGPFEKEDALKMEGQLISNYESSHNGISPKYNISKTKGYLHGE